MSDFEDEMDVDAPPVKESVLFSSDNTNSKGKRSAANLPVEAEDSLPWYLLAKTLEVAWANHRRVEKYRPDTLDDVSGHQDILATINKFVDTNVRSLLPSLQSTD
jgi:replication factor C subunit 3/5